MNLYIYTQNGTPINHPLTESNLLLVHPDIDLQNLPENICKFIRVQKPEVGAFQVLVNTSTYEIVDNICYDVWHIRDMSEEEKENKINSIESTKPYPSWTFDRQTLEFIPPTPQPDQGFWNWDEETLSWVEFVTPEE